ncbi:MAG: hypothetical protein OEY23_23365 [Acidimicrobiia bacterium]|nr:hypothetical protein [Acidimicrobiia bacterium]
MRRRKLALTGPQAAAIYGLDGYRDETWPARWCGPTSGRAEPGVIRTRWWDEPVLVGEVLVAPVGLVLRHLGDCTIELPDGVPATDRVELAVEHALRERLVTLEQLRFRGGGTAAGDRVLKAIVRRRGDEPPTESYAETRALQLFRSLGWRPWRQVDIVPAGRIVHRVDFVIPFPSASRRARRPDPFRPRDGLIVEIDGREVHEPQFERDHDRGSRYDALGYHWISLTPRQIDARRAEVESAIAGAMRRATRLTA